MCSDMRPPGVRFFFLKSDKVGFRRGGAFCMNVIFFNQGSWWMLLDG